MSEVMFHMRQEQGQWGVPREESGDTNWELDGNYMKINSIHEVVFL